MRWIVVQRRIAREVPAENADAPGAVLDSWGSKFDVEFDVDPNTEQGRILAGRVTQEGSPRTQH